MSLMDGGLVAWQSLDALPDSTLPRDVLGETVGMVKEDFHVEKKTPLHHATTSGEHETIVLIVILFMILIT